MVLVHPHNQDNQTVCIFKTYDIEMKAFLCNFALLKLRGLNVEF